MNILDEIRAELRKNVDRKYREGSVNFFKEKIRCYGVRTPITRKIANKYFQKINDNKGEFFCSKYMKNNFT